MLVRVDRWFADRPAWGETAWLAMAALMVARLHLSRPAVSWPSGSDWPQYVLGAAWIGAPSYAATWPDWRNPAYPYLLGLLRGDGTFVEAGQLIARVSMSAVLVGAALLARVLAGRLAAAATAITAGQVSLLALGIQWVNPYPLVGALTGLALAAGAGAAQRPGRLTVSAAAALASLCWVLEPRSLPVAAAAVGLAGAGILASRRARLLPFLLIGLPPLAWDRAMRALYDLPTLPLAFLVDSQHAALTSVLGAGVGSPVLAAACRPLPTEFASVDGLLGPCAVALHAFNAAELTRFGLIPTGFGLLFGVLLLLPAPDGTAPRRRWMATLVVFAIPALSVEAGMRWVVHHDRYLLPYLAPLIALAPVALARVAALFPGPSPALVAALLAVAWATFGWPGSRGAVSIVEADASEARRGAVIGWLAATTAPGTPVIDCALLDQVLAGAPLTVPAVPLRPELPPCRPFLQIAEPNGAVLIVRAESDAPGALEAQDDATLRALGWTRDPSPGQEYAVWRAPPAPTAVP